MMHTLSTVSDSVAIIDMYINVRRHQSVCLMHVCLSYMNPYMPSTLTLIFINVVRRPNIKFGSQIAIFANIDLGIAPKKYKRYNKTVVDHANCSDSLYKMALVASKYLQTWRR